MVPNGKWKCLLSFISAHKTEKGCEHTHTSLAEPACSFYIPNDSKDTFYALYEKALEKGDSLYITEKNRHIGPVVIDIDLRFPGPDLERRYDTDFVEKVVVAYIKACRKYLDVPEDTLVYVMEKSKPVLFRGIVKDGLHLIIPNIVTKASIKHLIRRKVLVDLKQVMIDVGSTNSIEDIVDEAIIEKNNWFMYGSRKSGPTTESYVVTTTYDFSTGRKRCVAQELQSCKLASNAELVRLFSLRNKYHETVVKVDQRDAVAAYESAQEEKMRNSNINKRILSGEVNTKQCYCENIEQIESLVDVLNPVRAESYDDWMRLGWCLRNIDNRLVTKWEEFSARSAKYKSGECDRLWDRMKEGGLGAGSLHLWAKKDNPTAYKELMKNDLRVLMMQSISMAHYDIAKVVHQMFQHDFVCCSYKNRYWYEFRFHRWNVNDSGLGLRIKLSEDVWRAYKMEAIEFQQRAINTNDATEQTRCEDIAKKLNDIASKLRNSSFKENIMKECSEIFYQEKFEDKLDSNIHLLGFKNGVYDLENHEFRAGRPDDYISFCTGNNFIEYDAHSPVIAEINEYMAQVLTKKDVREYVFKLFATFISGQIKEQKFYIWTGSGSNSKSKLVELFEKSYGDYCCKFPITLLTQKRAASNAANSELARAKGKRFACLQEPSEDEKINIGLMKELSGGDKIMARALFKEPFEFNPQFKMLLLCNHLPHVPSDDGGTWRRIRVVEFTSKFVENPQEENEFPVDYELSDKIDVWREHFMGLLIHYYKRYQVEGCTEPAEVLKCTTDYKSQNDHMSAYMEGHFEKKGSAFLTLDEAHVELRNWIKDDSIPIKLLSKPDLERYLSKNLTKCVNFNHQKGFKGYRLKSICPAEEEDF